MLARFVAQISHIEEKTEAISGYKDKVTGDARVVRQSLGWYVRFSDIHLSLHVGPEKPKNLDAGDYVTITVERMRS